MMSKVFIYSENMSLAGELISLGEESGMTVSAICLKEEEALSLSKYGAREIFVLNGDSSRPEDYAKPIADLLSEQNAQLFLVGATISGRELAAQVAALLKIGLTSDPLSIDFSDDENVRTVRTMHGGATTLAEVSSGLHVITVPFGKAIAETVEDAAPEMHSRSVTCNSKVRLIETQDIEREGVDISKAKRLVCVGMGFSKKEDLSIAIDLAEAIEGEIACTRPIASDREWMPMDTYIGLSGKVVKPDLFIALGDSGQIQHTYGIRDSKIIVGINNNEKATIFQVSDYGIVGDLYEVAPLLTQALKEA